MGKWEEIPRPRQSRCHKQISIVEQLGHTEIKHFNCLKLREKIIWQNQLNEHCGEQGTLTANHSVKVL